MECPSSTLFLSSHAHLSGLGTNATSSDKSSPMATVNIGFWLPQQCRLAVFLKLSILYPFLPVRAEIMFKHQIWYFLSSVKKEERKHSSKEGERKRGKEKRRQACLGLWISLFPWTSAGSPLWVPATSAAMGVVSHSLGEPLAICSGLASDPP